MFPRLRHDRVIGRDDKHGQVESRCAGEHVADKPFVARHVDEREMKPIQFERRKANVDRDSAPFSAGSRSVSIPVNARTRAVLPWSMCPAVPSTRSRAALFMTLS